MDIKFEDIVKEVFMEISSEHPNLTPRVMQEVSIAPWSATKELIEGGYFKEIRFDYLGIFKPKYVSLKKLPKILAIKLQDGVIDQEEHDRLIANIEAQTKVDEATWTAPEKVKEKYKAFIDKTVDKHVASYEKHKNNPVGIEVKNRKG